MNVRGAINEYLENNNQMGEKMTEPKWWDCTLSREETFEDGRPNPYYSLHAPDIGKQLMDHGAERCVVGEETGEDGYQHFQIRVVFKKPTSFEKCIAIFPQGHWSETKVRDFHYVEKEGNFWRSWEGALGRFMELDMYPWQNEIIARLEKQNDRQVMVIVDRYGNSGKTAIAFRLTAEHRGAYCPEMTDAKDYMAWALAHQTAGTFCLDIPKAGDIRRDAEIWKAVEQMKNGYLWDKRHHWQEAYIMPPKVLVLTNDEPDRTMLSRDRWDIGYLDYGISNWANTIKWERGGQ